ncbi:MAG TPA: M23 family metallopeptidase [Desulfuromonadales bacterium]|nr:M23 family metallopeptidase [Desulfuromonadales bacterium]
MSELTDDRPLHRRELASPSCSSFNELNDMIRDGKIDRQRAQVEFKRRLGEVRREYYGRNGHNFSEKDWVFPVAGYDARAIGGGKRHGFIAGGYDYFSGNRHGGHAAYDIFILDRNQDGRDDRNGKRVTILSMTGGIVVALADDWKPGSALRGGKYIWVYDPANELLVYYAHNEKLIATLGDILEPGDPLASMGRSGLNAFKKRSPTHLHFGVARVTGDDVRPVNVYEKLKASRKMRRD